MTDRNWYIKINVFFSHWAVKEKGESKPRQHTIDLSQMAVPIQLAQEKKPSPESPKPSTSSEAEPSAQYITAGTTPQQNTHYAQRPLSERYVITHFASGGASFII